MAVFIYRHYSIVNIEKGVLEVSNVKQIAKLIDTKKPAR